MTIALYLLAAILLDLLVGDPQGFPHPVRLIGKLCAGLETLTRRTIAAPRAAGVVTVLLCVLITGSVAWLLVHGAARLHPWLGHAVSILLIYFTIAARDLAKHAEAVRAALVKPDLELARQRVSWIVGRDTAALDEAQVSRAAVESVAESIVDGITAPLFFALLFGPVGAMVYRAINTMDSMFGYKNDKYFYFGWAPARLDDVANWLPARLTAPFLVLAAALFGESPRHAWRILRRDRRNHSSPNSGLTEAAMAGALQVQLGGTNLYFGQPVVKPTIGDPVNPLTPGHIGRACRLMLGTVLLFAVAGVALRLALTGWRPG